jgi:hypothetical protein
LQFFKCAENGKTGGENSTKGDEKAVPRHVDPTRDNHVADGETASSYGG